MKKSQIRGLIAALAVCFLWPSWSFADQVSDIIEKSRSDDYLTRSDAIMELGKQKDSRAVDRLIEILRYDKTDYCRSDAARALGDFDGPRDRRAVEPLIKAFREDPDDNVRYFAADALGSLKDARAMGPLLEAVDYPSPQVRGKVISSLAWLASNNVDPGKNKKIVDLAIKALRDSEAEVRREAALALGWFKEDRVVDALIPVLKDGEPLVRAFAIDSLAKIGDPRAIEAIRPLMNDPDPKVREYVARAFRDLQVSGDAYVKEGKYREALEFYMSELLANPFPDLREKIIDVVNKLDPKPRIPEEARKAMARGKVELEKAGSPEVLKKAAAEFALASELAPWWPDAYYNLGLVRDKQGEYQHAINQFKLYLYALPNAPDATAVKDKIYELEYKRDNYDKAVELSNQGAEIMNQGRYEEAMKNFEQAISLAPQLSYAHAAMGNCLFKLERYKEAIPKFEEAIRLKDRDLFTYVWAALAYFNAEENYDAAIEVTEIGLRMDPNSFRWPEMLPTAYFNLGTYYGRKENYAKALENYEKALEKGHPDPDEVGRRIEETRRLMGY